MKDAQGLTLKISPEQKVDTVCLVDLDIIPSTAETLPGASNGSQLMVSEEITNELNNQNTLSENPFVSAWQCLNGRGEIQQGEIGKMAGLGPN
jgi:hypothetical protein